MDDRTGSASSPAAALEETEPTTNQDLKVRGRMHTLLEKRVLVYDWESNTVRVESEKDIPLDSYQEVKLPSRRKRVTIFVDAETQSKPTLLGTTPEGRNNVELTLLCLDRLSRHHRLLRFIGRLPSFYLQDVPRPESSSQVTAESRRGGEQGH